MNPTRACLIALLASVALAACGGDPATAPNKPGVRATAGTVAHDEDEEPPVQPDGEFTVDGVVYCRRNGLARRGPCAELALTCAGPAGLPAPGANTFVTRGETVTCRAGLSPDTSSTSLSVTGWTFTGVDTALSVDRMDVEPAALPGATAWQGALVTSGTVTVTAMVGDALRLASSTIEVSPRPAEISPPYIMTFGPLPAGPGPTVKFPTVLSAGGALGLYAPQSPDWRQIAIATLSKGPNHGLTFVLAVPAIPPSMIFISSAVFPGDPWYEAHPRNRGPLNDLGLPICTQGEIDRLRRDIQRHEGLTLAENSHYGIDQALLRQRQFQRRFGGLVLKLPGSAADTRREALLTFRTLWLAKVEQLEQLSHEFDSTATPAAYAALGCSIFLKS